MSDVGWLGFGVGSTMSDADIVILWPNSDSSWTLSHRRATTTALPLLLGEAVDTPQSDSTSTLSIVPSLSSSSSSDSPTIVTFSRPLSPDVDGYTTAANYILKREINQGVIFAKGDENPDSEKQDADLKQHSLDSMGGSYVDLSVEFKADSKAIDAPLIPVKGESSTLPTGGGTSSGSRSESTSEGGSSPTGQSQSDSSSTKTKEGNTQAAATATGSASAAGSTATNSGSSSSSSTISSEGGKLSYATVIKIHAICAASAWLFFAPLGVLYARFGRSPTSFFKFPWHFFQQTWVTAPLTFGAVGLAYYATTLKASTTKSGHQTLGFAFAILLLIQVVLGWWTHESHEPTRPGEPPPARALKAWLHIIIGISLIGLGFLQVRLGMEKYGIADKMYNYGYWGAVGIFSAIYLCSLLFNVLSPSTPTTSSLPHHHPHHKHHKGHRSPRHHHERCMDRRPLKNRKSHSMSRSHRREERGKHDRPKSKRYESDGGEDGTSSDDEGSSVSDSDGGSTSSSLRDDDGSRRRKRHH